MMDNPPEYPYPVNSLAQPFPPLPPARYEALLVRIREYNSRPPITLWKGEIIHGVEFLQAYASAGVEPRFEPVPDDADPREFLMAESLPYQEMDDNARGIAAYLFSQWSTRGRPRAQDENYANLRNIPQEESAASFGVSLRLVSYASQVLSDDSTAIPELQQAVREWKIKCSDAAQVVDKPKGVQEKAVALVNRKKARTVKSAAELVEREIADAEAAAAFRENRARPLDETITLHVASMDNLQALVEPGSVDAIITHPPHTQEALPQYAALAALAAHALSDAGVLVVVGSGILLPDMLKHLEHPDLEWLTEFDLRFHGQASLSGRPHFIQLHRRPVLVYRKGGYRADGYDDLIEVPAEDDLTPGCTRHEFAMRQLVDLFAKPGQLVCDPGMLDRSGTALGARKSGCRFIGASERQDSIDQIIQRLKREEEILTAQAAPAAGEEGTDEDVAPPEDTGDSDR